MNLMEAFYKCMNDPESEFLDGCNNWYTFKEWMVNHQATNVNTLMTTESDVRKRKTVIDACLEEIVDLFVMDVDDEQIKQVLLKHWPKE